MNKLILLISSGALIAGTQVPDLPDPQPDPFVQRSEPSPVSSPEPSPEPSPELPNNLPNNTIPHPASRVGIVKVNKEESKWVNLVRPIGIVETCQTSTLTAPVGQEWASAEGPNCRRSPDGTWYPARPVTNTPIINTANT